MTREEIDELAPVDERAPRATQSAAEPSGRGSFDGPSCIAGDASHQGPRRFREPDR